MKVFKKLGILKHLDFNIHNKNSLSNINIKKNNISITTTKSFSSINQKTIYNKELQIKNKDAYGLKYRDTNASQQFYNESLEYLINTLHAVKYKLEEIIFFGPNPDVFIQKLPDYLYPEIFIYCDYSEVNLQQSQTRIDELLNNSNNQSNSNDIENKHNTKYNINYKMYSSFTKKRFPILIENSTKLPFQSNKFSCIVSHMHLNSQDNHEFIIKEYNRILKSNGCLICDFISEGSFYELNTALALSENEREGGISLNTHEYPSPVTIGNITSKYDFNLVSLNVNKYINYFDNAVGLMRYLKEIGETNCLIMKRSFKNRSFFISCIALYQYYFNLKKLKTFDSDNWIQYQKYIHTKKFCKLLSQKSIPISEIQDKQSSNVNNTMGNIALADENYLDKSDIDEDIVYSIFLISSFIAWKKDSSQQQPSKRGSAEFSLKDLINDSISSETDSGEIRYGSIIPKIKSNKNEHLSYNIDIYSSQEEVKKKRSNQDKESKENKLKNLKQVAEVLLEQENDEYEILDLTEKVKEEIMKKIKDKDNGKDGNDKGNK